MPETSGYNVDFSDIFLRLEEQIARLAERESQLEQRVDALQGQENRLAEHVRNLEEKERLLEEQLADFEAQEENLREHGTNLAKQVKHLTSDEGFLADQVLKLSDNVSFLLAQAAAPHNGDASAPAVQQLEENWKKEKEMNGQLRADLKVKQGDLESEQKARQYAERNLKVARRTIESLHNQIKDLTEEPPLTVTDDLKARDPERLESFEELLFYAQHTFSGLLIPNDALQDIRILKSSRDRRRAIGETAKALKALHLYASTKSGETGNFMTWNKVARSADRLPDDRIALMESNPTMQKHGSKRVLPVDTRVSPSGMIEMREHIKVTTGNAINIRIHFFDDTQGETGLVHIGYIGPHLPIASSS